MRLVMYAYNGMAWCMKENASYADLTKVQRKREDQGFTVNRISPTVIEVEDDGMGMISDYHGMIYLKPDTHRIYEAGER